MSEYKKLAAVAISYNEEKDLPAFIKNVEPHVDEIIIVDDGSTDRTAEIASFSPKTKFINSPRKEGEFYAQQRNKGINASESEWLLHMDIDERLTPEFVNELRTCLNSKDKKAFKFRRLNFFLHRPMKGGGWADWNLVHLAKRDVLKFEGMFHEEIILSCGNDQVGQMNSKMYHLNDESYTERLRKSANYQLEVAQSIRNKGIKVKASHLLMVIGKQFISKYFIKGGYKDGTTGLISALHSSAAAFKSYAMIWDEQNRISRAELENEIEELWTQK